MHHLMQLTGMASIRPGRPAVCPDGFPRPVSNTDLPISGICRSPGMGYLCVTYGSISGPKWRPV